MPHVGRQEVSERSAGLKAWKCVAQNGVGLRYSKDDSTKTNKVHKAIKRGPVRDDIVYATTEELDSEGRVLWIQDEEFCQNPYRGDGCNAFWLPVYVEGDANPVKFMVTTRSPEHTPEVQHTR